MLHLQLNQVKKGKCSFGCQEYTDQGVCLKRYNNDKYILTADGNYMIKNGKCQNYQNDCQICLNGFSQNRYLECNEVQQNMESDILIISHWIQQDQYRLASYKNGTFIIRDITWNQSFQQRTLVRDYEMILEIPFHIQISCNQ